MVELVDKLGERRDVVVTLDHGRHRAEMGDGCAIHIPYLVADRMVMGVDDVALLVAVTCDMELHHAVARHAVQKVVSREAVIVGADIDIVDVEQEPAIGAVSHFAHELPFGHLGLAEGDVARYVLKREPAAEEILNLAHAVDDVVESFTRVGDGQEVVQIHAMHPGPTEMIGDPFRVDAGGERLQPREIVKIERRGGGDGERYAMHHHGIALADPVEHAQRLAALDHVILGEHLEPVDFGRAVQDLGIMLRP